MLQGKKVMLRAITRQDLERLHQFNNDLEVEIAGGGEPPMPQSLARLQAEFDGKVSQGGRDGTEFAIEADNKFIGHCALFQFDNVGRTCALGITIGDKDYWGRGYGRDAISVLLDYAFRVHNVRRVFLAVNGNNERAMRAYRACGFVEEGRLRAQMWNDGAYVDLVYMGIFKEEREILEEKKADPG